MQHHTTTVGLLHPGQMGASVGACAREGGARVLWVSEGRSDQTRARAEKAGLEDVPWLNALVNQSDTVICVCPPHAAAEVAQAVAGLGYRGLYVDANAISPESAQGENHRLFVRRRNNARASVDARFRGMPRLEVV